MPLARGDKLGPYEIVDLLGKGGMGEVYRAHDTNLSRDVAIKVLPAALAQDPDRLARFEREAKVLAAMNHPNVAIIHGLENTGTNARAIVMELVEGPTLADRLEKGTLPLNETLSIARQIADALEAAHEKGVVHRDLKPANVKAREDGTVKVLDFGLATAVLAGVRDAGHGADSPTLTLGATQAGMILGTAAYMAPEQAEGKAVDRRADIWSFGVVLWEMLTGKRLFHADTVPLTLADVLRKELDFTQVPDATPAPVRELLKRCLDRDVKSRLQAIGEARVAIQKHLANPESGATSPAQASSLPHKWQTIPWAVAGVGLTIAAGMTYLWQRARGSSPDPQVLRYTLSMPERIAVNNFAISPNGRYLAIVGTGDRGSQLYVRALDSLQTLLLPGTEVAAYPFWSPDSRFIAFFGSDKLKKVDVTGGPAQTLCDAPNSRGGAWSPDGVIVFGAQNGTSLQRVSAAGGVPVEIKKAELGNFRFPAFLPDGRRFLYTHRGGKEPGVYVASLDSKNVRRLALDQSNAMYAPPSGSARTGHVLFVREQTLMAQPVDPASMEPAGDVFPVAERVSPQGSVTLNQYSLSANGVLVYQTGETATRVQLAWFDREGKQVGTVGGPVIMQDFALSPDGKRAVIQKLANGVIIGDGPGPNSDLWMFDLEHNVESRFTFDPSQNRFPVWSPDGSQVVFESSRTGVGNIYEKASNNGGQERQLFVSENQSRPYDWSRDGKFLIFDRLMPKTQEDIFAWPLTVGGETGKSGDQKPIPLVQSPAQEWMGQLSPDASWLAYVSDETGRPEVYVQPFAPGSPKAVSGKWQISSSGGGEPRWRADGKELFYLSAEGKLMVAAVETARTTFERSTPQPLFDTRIANVGANGLGRTTIYHYAAAADGKRFLMAVAPASGGETHDLNVVVNWMAGVKK